jgi:hypothetical protein
MIFEIIGWTSWVEPWSLWTASWSRVLWQCVFECVVNSIDSQDILWARQARLSRVLQWKQDLLWSRM